MASERPIAGHGWPEGGRHGRATLPSVAALASLGTVLCVYRSRHGGELGGWAQAASAESWCGIDSDGWHECLQFRDRSGQCCWRLYLLPDSDFFAWEQLSAQLPRAEAQPSHGDGIATRLWRRMASRVGGERWLASVLRLHTMQAAPQASATASMPVLAASLAPVSVFGADVVRRIARIEGIDSGGPLDDCCCRRFAVIAPPQVAYGGDAMAHKAMNTMQSGGTHDPFPYEDSRMNTRTTRLRWGLLLALLPVAGFAQPASSGNASDIVRDRASILAMQGEYAVDFAFDETVLLQPDYARASAQRSGADEVVIVVEDTPRRVVLQHILVEARTGHVTKHWRQDWVYEAAQRFEFSADQTWAVRAIPADDTRGAWTQCVYEVSDAPRYCGTGRWTYAGGVATWTSGDTWRPLPRREYTKRSDYNAVDAINRHTITPAGWTHEQFNTKVRRGPGGARVELAREFGFNDYHKTTGTDFGPAYRYWNATAGYWARVRARWDGHLGRPPGLHLKTKIDGMAMIIPLFAQAGEIEAGRTVADADIDRVFAEWTAPAAAAKDQDATAGR